VVAVKDIRQGEEVCIDYIGAKRLRLSGPIRRRRLLREYLFDCACVLCGAS
jgi:SET domain-containing protein